MQKKAARRGTRALAFLLCLLMAVSLLPVMGANAAVGDVSATGVELNKTLTLQNNDGTYTITLEAFATGTVTSETVTEPVPTDFVLVLDQSGSMAKTLTSYTYTAERKQDYSYSNYSGKKLYYKDGDTYYQVYRYRNDSNSKYYLRYKKNGTYYYLASGDPTTEQNKASSASRSSGTIWTGVLYKQTESSTRKLAALKTAVTNFVTSVQNQTYTNGTQVGHRIAIVGFSSTRTSDNYDNTELLTGVTIKDGASNSMSTQSSRYSPDGKTHNGVQYGSITPEQYAAALQDVTTSEGQTSIKNAINALTAYGGTQPQMGLEMANQIFGYRKITTYPKADGTYDSRNTVVVMFTDGQPGNNDDDDRIEVANSTIDEAKTAKNTYNAKVFTIGVFDGSDETKLVSQGDTSNYSIKDYMTAVSSNYPAAESLSSKGTANTDGKKYYAMATDSEALNAAFQSVSSSVNNSSTSCTLDAESVLTDVISGNLDLPANFSAENNVKVYTATCNGKDENGNPTFADPVEFSTASVTVRNKTVDVSGFDYKNNYVTGVANADDTFSGEKLIVTITGLIPNQAGDGQFSNENTSGIDHDGELRAAFERPSFSVASRNVVIDFGMTANIARNVRNKNTQEGVQVENGGTFTYGNDETLTFKPTVEKDVNGNYTLPFTGVSSALYYGVDYTAADSPNAWTWVNVIPANNVYYDDDLLNSFSDFTDGNYGYDVNVPSNTDTTAVPAGTPKTFTFTGTGIDVYCTTESTSGWVTARLSKMVDGVDTYVDGAIMKNQYVSEPCLYNVPTLSFTALEYGTYTLTINTDDNSNYKLDGVRIYNPANADAVAVGKASGVDVQAQFVNVRDTLLSATPNELTEGAVYVDAVRTTDDISVYEKIGPKNEVYLDQNQKVGFQLTGVPEGAKVLVGLSAPENQGATTVKVTCGSKATVIPVESAIDMYYPVTVSSNGYVVIENTRNVLLSVTNVQICGGDGTSSAKLMASPELMSYMADFDTLAVVDTTPAPEVPTPETPNNTISAIIHAIWSSVRDSIGRLFGRL